MHIFSIESSCDETAMALVSGHDEPEARINLVASQIDLHRQTNGIVPEVAAREQLKAIVPMLSEFKSQLPRVSLTIEDLDAIAVTKGPGLIGSLLVGVEAAKTLSELWHKPVYGIHHLEGHIYAALAGIKPDEVNFPLLALVVSGGHTQLVLMQGHFQYEVIGTTRDDAAGEAFDKSARLLGLSYPGGPAIAQAAQAADAAKTPPLKLALPRPMLYDQSLDFSFSGLKTALYYRLQQLDHQLAAAEDNQYAREVQLAIVQTLVGKTKQAIEAKGVRTLVLVGGVSANQVLRDQIQELVSANLEVLIPDYKLTTDNAAMIGIALWYRLKLNHLPAANFEAKPRLDLTAESKVDAKEASL